MQRRLSQGASTYTFYKVRKFLHEVRVLTSVVSVFLMRETAYRSHRCLKFHLPYAAVSLLCSIQGFRWRQLADQALQTAYTCQTTATERCFQTFEKCILTAVIFKGEDALWSLDFNSPLVSQHLV